MKNTGRPFSPTMLLAGAILFSALALLTGCASHGSSVDHTQHSYGSCGMMGGAHGASSSHAGAVSTPYPSAQPAGHVH
jgi:hypothetical protein